MAQKKLLSIKLSKIAEIEKIWYQIQRIPEQLNQYSRIPDYGAFMEAQELLNDAKKFPDDQLGLLKKLESTLESNFAEIGIPIPNDIQGRIDKIEKDLKGVYPMAESVFKNGLKQIKPVYTIK